MRERIALFLESLADWMRGKPMPRFSEAALEAADGLPLPSDFHRSFTLARHTDHVDVDGNKIQGIDSPPQPTATDVVNHILDRPIEWVNWKALPPEARLQWSNDAVAVLRNRAFISLCGRTIDREDKTNGELVKTLIESGFRHSETVEQLRNMRMTINGIELIRENLEKMMYQIDEPTMDDLNAAV